MATLAVDQEQAALPASDPTPSVDPADASASGSAVTARLRQVLLAEIESMTLFLMSEGRAVGPRLSLDLARIEQDGTVALELLLSVHGRLSHAVSPAKPRAIMSLQQEPVVSGLAALLGPMPGVRRLNCASLFFAATFLVISLSGDISLDTMSKSIYELDGYPLAVKLWLVVSAAGLGASFATLFSVWEDLRQHRFEPLAESASWMQIGLGIVAGLMLSEVIGPEEMLVGGSSVAAGTGMSGMSEPLLALIGGFSAGVLHMILLSIVNAFRRAFGQDRDPVYPVEGGRRLDISSATTELAALQAATGRQIVQLPADGRVHGWTAEAAEP